ncbi:MAG: antitoxin [Acidobacteria bacterium]|nr:antitoxin [Acidobacteriota bacterium]
MARVNVYLPEDLAERARRADLNVSALAQDAVRRALGAHETTAWLATLAAEPASDVSHEAALESLDAERDEAGTRHG